MGTLFYLIGLIFFISEIAIIGNPQNYLKKIRMVEELNKNEEGEEKGRKLVKDSSSLSEEEKQVIRFTIFAMLYFGWSIIGALFSGQWLLFVGLIAFGFAIGFYRRRFYKNNTRKSLQVIKFDAIVSSIWLAIIILNHFHKFL